MKKFLIALFILVLAGFLVLFYLQQKKKNKLALISSFEECEVAGYPVRESYPPFCTTPDGRTFAQDIGNELEYQDFINVEYPRPNYKIENPLKISGQARGGWFWEANASAELYDANDNSIGTENIVAIGEWMTEEFVSFEGTMEFETPETKTGKLIIRNGNASGLPENSKELVIPVKF
jgi:hypothetical protein